MNAPPAPKGKVRAAAKAATRARLLEVAIDRFAADGLDASFDAIAADAGLTKGALYHHFGSRDGLLTAVYKEAINRHAEQVVAASSTGDGRTRLLALVDESARLLTSRTPFYRLLSALHLAAATSLPHLEPVARRVQDNQRTYMVALVRAGQADGSISPARDAEAVGITTNAALQGFLVSQLDPAAQQRRWVRGFRTLLEEIL